MDSFLFYIKRLYSYSGSILFFNILGMSVISIFDGMAIFLLIPLINFSGLMDISAENNTLIHFFSNLKSYPDSIKLPILLSIFTIIVVLQNIIQKKLTISSSKINQGFIGNLRIESYQNLLNAEWGFFIRKRKSDLINIMTIELARVTGGINQFLFLLNSIVFTVIHVGIALWLSAKLTGLVLLSALILSLFSKKYINQSRALGKNTSVLAQEYLAGITDQLNGIKEIKSNAIVDTQIKWLETVVNGMFKEQVAYMELKTSSQIFYKISLTILISVFIYLSFTLFNAQPGQFLLIIIIFSRIWPRITGIQANLEQLASTIPAFKAFKDLNDECKEAKEFKRGETNTFDLPLVVKNNIQCRNVFFRYNKNDIHYALNEINLSIAASKMTAIVGHSGAGKSTLIDVIMGLNKPEIGDLLIDGESLTSEELFSLRKEISYVPQDPFLFNATIRENLLMVVPDVSDDQIWEALEFAAAADFVRNLPQGPNTLIGDRGVRLSGGERQRLVLARAILRNPSILILDEATSALDSENEIKIQAALEGLKGKMTIIVIAHRLSTIRNADQVIVLEQGRIIQTGSYNELANEEKGVFNQMLEQQMKAPVFN